MRAEPFVHGPRLDLNRSTPPVATALEPAELLPVLIAVNNILVRLFFVYSAPKLKICFKKPSIEFTNK